MKTYSFDHYYEYEEMTQVLKEVAEDYPELIKVNSICTTPENREVWACEITNYKTGGCMDKPAYYVDANHHAGEVTGSMAAIHLIVTLVQKYGTDEKITSLLDNKTVYVIPRITPDGAETYLTSSEKLRSVNRPYPFEKLAPGLHPADMDGDGVIRIMRVPSANGVWKESSYDKRIMTRRSPSDFGGKYYNIYPEGHIVDYDGANIKPAIGKWCLDFNRNYPLGWFPEVRQPGAGKYPLSNPENKAIADFVINHENICGAVTYHTSGGCYIYPPGTKPSKDADQRDMRMFKEIGTMVKEETGYECFNIFDGFLEDTVNFSSGAFDDWMYQAQGIPTYTAELWDLAIRAGVPDPYPHSIPKTPQQQEHQMAECYKWIDKNVPEVKSGKPIKEWTEFNHPQLGKIEIGSFDFKYTWQNCPPGYLEQEVEKNTNFCLRMAATLPQLNVDNIGCEKIAENVFKVKAQISNIGYLPTFVCNEAKSLNINKPVVANVDCRCEMIMGKKQEILGDIEGFSGVETEYSYDNITTYEHDEYTKFVEWVVKAEEGTEFKVEFKCEKAGKVSASVILR